MKKQRKIINTCLFNKFAICDLYLFGSWDDWKQPIIPKSNKFTLYLKPGNYQFKFFNKNTSKWHLDDNLPTTNTDGFINHILVVTHKYIDEYDSINSRINFINKLLSDANLNDIMLQNYKSKALNKKKYDLYELINQIGGKLQYIKSGSTGHTFKGIIKGSKCNKVNYAVKIVPYPREKYGDINDIQRPENAELMMIRLLSYFVVRKQTPHIILPIGTFNASIKPFVNLIEKNVVSEDNKEYYNFVNKYKKGYYYNNVSILINEWANKGDLLDFIRKNYREFQLIHWKVFFFQLISVLAIIQSKYPSFRHNDLKANNILVHKVKQRGTLFSYTVNRSRYIVPSIGYQIKLWDFDFACIPGIVDNKKVSTAWANKINIKPVKNRYYDLHYFFNTLIRFNPEIITKKCIPNEVIDFIDRMVPSGYKTGKFTSERGRILHNIEYITPNEVLQNDKFFEEFRNVKIKKIKIIKIDF